MPHLSFLFADIDILGQKLAGADVAVILLLVLLEGVLSIDNALVLGLLAKRLPKHQRQRALSYGLIGAFVFRVIAICTASFLLQWTFVKFLGGGYLVYIAVKHLFFEAKEEHDDKLVLDESGQMQLVDEETGKPLTSAEEELEIKERIPLGTSLLAGDEENEESAPAKPALKSAGISAAKTRTPRSFWGTVLVIELTDIAFAVDSILAAMALAGARKDKLWLVITGGMLGVILMRFAASLFIRMLERWPRFELSAYLLVIVIGLKLLGDWGLNSDWSFQEPKWIANRLGGSKQTFADLEASRRNLVHSYEDWLKKNWVFGLAKHQQQPVEPEPGQAALPPEVPHLLDFHDLRRPECMSFWLIMVICFLVGFLPAKEHTPKAKT